MSGLEGSACPAPQDGAALRAEAVRQRELLDSVDDGVFLCDSGTGDVVDCNAGALALFGYDGSELARLTMGALSAEDEGYSKERLIQWFHDAVRHGKVRFEWRSRRRDGRAFWSELRVTRSSAGASSRVVVVVRDVSAMRESIEKLRLAETRYRLLVNHLPNSAIVLCDRDLRFVLVDGPVIAGAGFTKEAMEGRAVAEVLPADIAKPVCEYIRRALGGETFDVEVPAGDHYYLCHHIPIRDDAGEIVYALILAVNVTERRVAEAAQRASEERFTRIFELSPAVITVTRIADGKLLEMNPLFEQVFGWTRAEALHKTTHELQLWPDEGVRDAFIAELQCEGKVDNRELRFRRKDGVVIDGISSTRSIDLDGHVCMLSIFRDVSEQRRAREALQASEDRFRVLSEATFEGIGFSDQGKIVDVNDQFAAMFRTTREKMIGAVATEFVAPQSIDLVRSHMRAGNTEPYEHFAQRADGTIFPVEVRPRLVHIGGKPMRVSAVRDVTRSKEAAAERERLISELSAKNAEMEQFTYTVSHDLKSPLVTINGFLGLLERDLEDGDIERVRSDVGRIGSAARKMMHLLDDLVELSRVGRVANTPTEVPLGEIVADALELVSGSIAERNVEIVVMPDLPAVWGDKVRLVQVVQNLLENAVKYMGGQKAPRIEVGVRPDPDWVIAFVRDNGIGVDPRYAGRIFNLFEKLDPRVEGTGVGLALVKRIVEFHRGAVSVESDGASGSTFVFRLPKGESPLLGRRER
jgi:PAS domain S-box-containing protein